MFSNSEEMKQLALRYKINKIYELVKDVYDLHSISNTKLTHNIIIDKDKDFKYDFKMDFNHMRYNEIKVCKSIFNCRWKEKDSILQITMDKDTVNSFLGKAKDYNVLLEIDGYRNLILEGKFVVI